MVKRMRAFLEDTMCEPSSAQGKIVNAGVANVTVTANAQAGGIHRRPARFT
jgi:hypothetical protein